MPIRISHILRELEQKQNCRILFAAESGSRAWGFDSPDSDYDIRAIYVKPLDWYLSIEENTKDTFESMLPGDLDVSARELRKTLRQFFKSNLSLLEWFGSPIRYEADSRFVAEILPLIPEFFDPHKALHHYLAQHNRAMEDLDAEKTIGIKKLFYALRGFFAALWCLKRKTMPPTLFESLLLPELCPAEILSWIEKLKEEKKNSREMQRIPMPMELYAFFQHRRCFLEQHLSFEKKTQPGMEALNQIFRSFIPEKI